MESSEEVRTLRTVQVEKMRELLGVTEDKFKVYSEWAWGQVKWSVQQSLGEEDLSDVTEEDEEDLSVSDEDLPQESPAQQASGPQNKSVFGKANINATYPAVASSAAQGVSTAAVIEAQRGLIQLPQNQQIQTALDAISEIQIPPPLDWVISSESEEFLGAEINRKIEEQCMGKLSIKTRRNNNMFEEAPWFMLVVLLNACKKYNYNPRIAAPPLVKDQTATVMWNLMRISSKTVLSAKTAYTSKTPLCPKTVVKNAAKTVYRYYGHGDFPNVNELKEKRKMVKMLKTLLNYPLDLEDRFYVWILFYTANLQRKAISKANENGGCMADG
ncbi:hypothetical protein BZA77DRAFT_388331 [Pyronema omphalodes]|nr:hypothetical protein BZA77DRAFT_388331 [Pyronema omphalodes]